jgi:hypothetical protein
MARAGSPARSTQRFETMRQGLLELGVAQAQAIHVGRAIARVRARRS